MDLLQIGTKMKQVKILERIANNTEDEEMAKKRIIFALKNMEQNMHDYHTEM